MFIVFGFERAFLCGGTLLTIIVFSLYLYFKHSFSYWKKRGIPSVKPSFPFGNIGDAVLLRKQMGLVLADIYLQLKGHKVGGFYQMHQPVLMLRDLNVIKAFLVENFGNFHDRGVYSNPEKDPISGHLFFLPGQKWKQFRAKLTPTFTSAKMKMMFQTVQDCAEILKTNVETQIATGDVIEVNDLLARYTTDVIASCAFGIQCNCLIDPNAEFRLKGRDFFARGLFANIAFMLCFLVPSVAAIFNLGNTPKPVSDFFLGVVRDTVNYREKTGVKRDDFMQLLIQLKDQGYVDVDDARRRDADAQANADPDAGSVKHLTLNEITAQAFVFYLAGFETSGTTLTFCLYELAVNFDIQQRLRKELSTVLQQHGGNTSYDALQEMQYLDMILSETLRVYPILSQLNRICTEKYRLPDSGLVVEPGTLVVVPVYGIHHDPQYYPDPERFDPERFTPEETAKRNPYTYLPFGRGPRNCIGMRFAMMQMKVAIVSLISNYEVRVCDKTHIPPPIDTQTFLLTPQGGIFLQALKTKCEPAT